MRFPSDSPASQARLARAIEKERAARMPKTTRGTQFEEHLRAIGHPAAKWDYDSAFKAIKEQAEQCAHVWMKDHITGLRHCLKCRIPIADDAIVTPPQDPRAQEQAALVPGAQAHCQCPACKDGVTHASDCSVHNMPAYPNGPCDCGAAPGPGRWEDTHTQPPAIGFYKVAWPEHLEEDHIAYWGGDEWGWMMSPGQEDYAKQYYKAGKRHALGKLQWQSHPTPAERAKSGGWIEHDGGPCPCVGADIFIRYRGGKEIKGNHSASDGPWWRHQPAFDGERNDIIAYRLIQP